MSKPDKKDERKDLRLLESAEVFENLYRLIYRDEHSPLYLNSLKTISERLDRCSKLVELRIKKCRNNTLPKTFDEP